MIRSKVIDILRTFSKEDIKKFSDYLASPLFNKREVILKLFNIYKKYHPDFSDTSLTKEKVFRKISDGKTYNDEVFRNLNSILLKHAEDFLSYLNYSGNPVTVKKHLLSEINFRSLLPVFEKHFEESGKLLESEKHRDIEYFFRNYNMFLQKDIYNSFINRFSKEDIIIAEKNLVIFFITKIMEIQNYILYECRILGLDNSLYLNDNFLESILKNIPSEIKQLPQIKIYYNALKLEQTNKETYYNNLKELLFEHGDLIEKEKHYNMYADMIDYIKRTRPKDDLKTTSEIFELRKDIIEKNLFTENFITNMFFLNVVKSGLKLGKSGWVENFINNYGSLLTEKYRESTKELSYANLHFEKKDFGKALSFASRVRYEDNYYNLEVRNLTARIYYETDSYEILNDFINSYRMYLSKNRALNIKDISSHTLFLSFTGKLLKIKELNKYHKLDELEAQVLKKDFINKYWILEKIKELEKDK
ncbi:MAG: hypothetical protein IPH77_04965 [Ignavibacteria bacterium]|nr:hypothetical protein [Ignavibacteria bacterium]